MARLADGEYNLIAIHAFDHLMRLDRFLDRLGKLVEIVFSGGLRVEIEDRSEDLFDVVGLQRRDGLAEQQNDGRAARGIRVRTLLCGYRMSLPSYADLHVIFPVSLALHTPVDFEHDQIG